MCRVGRAIEPDAMENGGATVTNRRPEAGKAPGRISGRVSLTAAAFSRAQHSPRPRSHPETKKGRAEISGPQVQGQEPEVRRALGSFRDGEAPAEPKPFEKPGSAGASPSLCTQPPASQIESALPRPILRR